MKKIYFIMFICLLSDVTTQAQKVISNGFPGVGVIDGTSYTRTSTIGSGNYSYVAANANKGLAKSQLTDQLYIIDLATNTIIDSMTIASADMELIGDTLLAVRGTHIYRVNITTKAIIDSIDISAGLNGGSTIELHPTKKELWIKADSMIYVVDYSTALSKTSFLTGMGGDIRFTKGGSTAYTTLSNSKKLLKVNAITNSVIDSSAALPDFIVGVSVSSDSDKVFVSSSTLKKIYIFQSSDLSLIDSFDSPREPFWLYRHPSRAELWSVNHFADTVTVYKESDYSELASIELPPSPHKLAFAIGPVSITDIHANTIDVILYPNPASDNITLSLPIGTVYKVSIFDNVGRMLKVISTEEPIITLPVGAFATGNYFVNIIDNNGNTATIQWTKK